ncbi:hypothetical protein SELMODRAFT_441097 [Selaginella moellendorffii]|uniref:Cytochrome b561 domain-containing protein n=1 Tax=Selaginella moellendorffii TaxID=88036 RepID=D8RGF8_SELML|nr:cytochrome b561, DM13 and DOMON domain-containing protein At5g54830 [Selaginella moellendorffii]EFJ28588.1 hypothetical protein SELMODRAFT_441097 [Selaginella moellendorffii]|eukprot:XP_002970458.1 cytochrome b561, DM13 and DOMON domain-containing protein At5g54830 [Selaginella moellendorffii]
MKSSSDRPTGTAISLAPIPLLLLLLCSSIGSGSSQGCSKDSPLVGFSADLGMIQHQLRGRVTILDDCSFRVTGFDMIQGSPHVCWWGSLGEDFRNLTQGFPVSAASLNHTLLSDDMEFQLLENVTWEKIQVLAVWDEITASDFGHVVLDSSWKNSSSSSSSQRKVPATVLENCVELSPLYRLRWSLLPGNSSSLPGNGSSVDIALEAVVPETKYMAFGWAMPGKENYLMMNADVVVAGFKNRDTPFAEDYYISKYSECNWDFQNPSGVCPDVVYDSSSDNSTTVLVHGQHVDGVAFVRYNRPLYSSDTKLDVSIAPSANMTVIWALGPLKPPDSLQPFYWPQNHGGPGRVSFGHVNLVLSEAVNQCSGPLVATEAEPTIDVIVADRGSPLVVTSEEAAHYPNPPSPTKVLHINKKEAPIVQVERGVPVIFSIQAGHDVAFYITSDPVGGATNPNETIFAGGPDAHGVLSHPLALSWLPNRTTPDEVYYQAFFEKKMGWKIQVVDGGLSDMYNSSVVLAEQQVTVFWTTSGTNISFAVRGERKSGYLAISFGRGMVNSFAYVGWVGADGTGYVKSYWIDGRDASNIHQTSEELWDRRCSSEKGAVTFEFTRSLQPRCSSDNDRACKKNVVDPSVPLRIVWAMGSKWDANFPSDRNMHDRTSRKATVIYLEKGAAEADEEVKPVLVVHGFMMFLAWAVLFPGGVVAARYLKHLENNVWFQAHTYLQYSGVTVMLLAFLFAAAELRGLHTETVHVKLGLFSILLACFQPVNAFFRPAKSPPGQQQHKLRMIWEYLHVYSGRGVLVFGLVTLASGMSLLADIYGSEHVRGFEWALLGWVFMVSGIIGYLELRQFWNKGKAREAPPAWDADGRSVHVLDDSDEEREDDSAGLLVNGNSRHEFPAASRGMEVQLEAFH